MAEAVPLGELLHEEALFGLTASKRWEYPEDAYSRLDFASPPYLQVVWAWPDPIPTRLKRVEKMYSYHMVDGARSIALYDACTTSLRDHATDQETKWRKD